MTIYPINNDLSKSTGGSGLTMAYVQINIISLSAGWGV